MRIRFFKLVLLTAIMAGAAGPAAAQSRWTTYANARFGTTADYPADLFTKRDPPPENGDGQSFQTADGRAQLSIYGSYNVEADTPASYLAKYGEREGVTYKRVTASYYAISGLRDGKIFYDRCNFRPHSDTIDCLTLTYPAREKAAWDPIITRISPSLRGGRGIAP
jgi:hypothetical protein